MKRELVIDQEKLAIFLQKTFIWVTPSLASYFLLKEARP